MTLELLLTALGLVLVLEGLMPMLVPAKWRELFVQIAQLKDGQIRFIGFGLCVVGLFMLLFLR